jgi:glyoxalase family protein
MKGNQIMERIKGLHHITAIAGSARKNLEFYTNVLGLRLVKKTVNFDDPGTYHFYFGDETGTPGTILTFFPWEGITQGKRGTGIVSEIGYSVPEGSFEFWMKRFDQFNVIYNKPAEKFGEQYLTFLDPDGLKLELIIPAHKDERPPFETPDVNAQVAARGFHNITITQASVSRTAAVLTDIFGYKLDTVNVNRFRYKTDAVETANIVDLVEAPGERRALNGGGTVHHVAFRVKDEETLMQYREKVLDAGFDITPKIDRNYFYSLYFREPGGVLFEIATDNPGFAVDESVSELGKNLRLPAKYESHRKEIENALPVLN